MCLKIKCKYCGDIFESDSIARRVCDKPDCRSKRRGTRTQQLICRVCGNPIPIGSGRRKYCSPTCETVGKKALEKIWQNTHKVTRCGCFMDCKAEVVYKSIDGVKV